MPLIAQNQPAQVATPESKKDEASESRKALIETWVKKVKKAKKKWEPDFERMKENEAFVSGLQWNGQTTISHERYTANFCNRLISQKVATLYARNPQAIAKRRKRLDFAVWDEKLETVVAAAQQVQMALMSGMPPSPNAWAILQDFEQGKERQKMVERVGKTLEIVYQYQVDTQEPDFKTQMKQLVRRVCVCGVAYVRLSFCRDYEGDLTSSETRTGLADRTKRAKQLLEKLEKGELHETNKEMEELEQLISSMKSSVETKDSSVVKERLVFDFPSATSIIPDEDTRILKGFVGAKWVAHEYLFDADFIRSFFEKDVKNATSYTNEGQPGASTSNDGEGASKAMFCVWDVINLTTKNHFIICDGFKDYLQEPEPVEPVTNRFWPIFTLIFNDVETEKGSKASVFPPSDVDLMKHAQKEHNRIRQALRVHRKANRPLYGTPKGMLSDEDKDALQDGEDNEVVDLQAVPPGTDPKSVIFAMPKIPLDPLVYDTKPQQEDALLTTGAQEANVGPAQPNVTATVGTIAEQSRMTVSSSNVDDQDDLLSALAEAGGEACLRNMSQETVHHIAGPGAVWPDIEKDDFLNELNLQIVAASSGRPNKAIDVANWERLAPLLLQAGANTQALIRETVKRADDQLEPSDFFPLPTGLPPQQGGPQSQGAPVNPSPSPSQPLQDLPSGTSVPLAGA